MLTAQSLCPVLHGIKLLFKGDLGVVPKRIAWFWCLLCLTSLSMPCRTFQWYTRLQVYVVCPYGISVHLKCSVGEQAWLL